MLGQQPTDLVTPQAAPPAGSNRDRHAESIRIGVVGERDDVGCDLRFAVFGGRGFGQARLGAQGRLQRRGEKERIRLLPIAGQLLDGEQIAQELRPESRPR